MRRNVEAEAKRTRSGKAAIVQGHPEVEMLRQWIQSGAVYQEHVSYRARGCPRGPARGLTLNPIDRFILVRLETDGLAPSREAERAVLLRLPAFEN